MREGLFRLHLCHLAKTLKHPYTPIPMTSFFEFLNSSVGRKWLMALTGLFLCIFLVVHVSGNLQLFKDDNGMSFNQYSVFMTTFTPIKVVSYLLYATVIVHAINGFYLMSRNRKARPVSYASKKDTRSSSWASRNMGVLGTILLIFIVTHMANFWYSYKFGSIDWKTYVVEASTGKLVTEDTIPAAEALAQNLQPVTMEYMGNNIIICKDLYSVVAEAFKSPALSAFYILSMAALSYHLLHGFQSAFHTLGLRRKRYESLIRTTGLAVFGVIIPALFASMPIYFLFVK